MDEELLELDTSAEHGLDDDILLNPAIPTDDDEETLDKWLLEKNKQQR
jgi:hypothetical protein